MQNSNFPTIRDHVDMADYLTSRNLPVPESSTDLQKSATQNGYVRGPYYGKSTQKLPTTNRVFNFLRAVAIILMLFGIVKICTGCQESETNVLFPCGYDVLDLNIGKDTIVYIPKGVNDEYAIGAYSILYPNTYKEYLLKTDKGEEFAVYILDSEVTKKCYTIEFMDKVNTFTPQKATPIIEEYKRLSLLDSVNHESLSRKIQSLNKRL